MDQIKPLHFDIGCGLQTNSACIIDHRVNAAKFGLGCRHRRLDRFIITHIQLHSQRITTCRNHLISHRVNGARQFGVRGVGFSSNHHIGPIGGGAQSNGAANAAAGSGDKNCAVFQCRAHVHCSR